MVARALALIAGMTDKGVVPDHFYKILLNGSWAIIAAIICKYFAICVERWVADIYNDDNRKKREENDNDTTHSS